MNIASVMAVYDGSDGSTTAIQTALGIGQTFDAVTAVLQVEPPTNVVEKIPQEKYVAGKECRCVEDFETSINSDRRRFESFFHDTVIANGLPIVPSTEIPPSCSFGVLKLAVTGHENREVARRGRLFDLIVLPRPSQDRGDMASATVEAALLDTGRPVMIAAGDVDRSIADGITVAWDGSREAAISVRNALPFIRRADSVEVVHVSQVGEKRADPKDVKRYLALHGIQSEARVVPRLGRHPSEVILHAAHENKNTLVVMGAHGEGDIAEFPVGGVTESVIHSADLNILLSH